MLTLVTGSVLKPWKKKATKGKSYRNMCVYEYSYYLLIISYLYIDPEINLFNHSKIDASPMRRVWQRSLKIHRIVETA